MWERKKGGIVMFHRFWKLQARKTKQKEANTKTKENRESKQKEETIKWERKSSLFFIIYLWTVWVTAVIYKLSQVPPPQIYNLNWEEREINTQNLPHFNLFLL